MFMGSITSTASFTESCPRIPKQLRKRSQNAAKPRQGRPVPDWANLLEASRLWKNAVNNKCPIPMVVHTWQGPLRELSRFLIWTHVRRALLTLSLSLSQFLSLLLSFSLSLSLSLSLSPSVSLYIVAQERATVPTRILWACLLVLEACISNRLGPLDSNPTTAQPAVLQRNLP